MELDQNFVCNWVQGDESAVAELAKKYNDELQSIYIAHPEIEIAGFEDRTELLSAAQEPPISWRPDGIDTLQWLTDN